MRAVTEWLVFRPPAGAPEIGFAGFHIHRRWRLGGNFGFGHSCIPVWPDLKLLRQVYGLKRGEEITRPFNVFYGHIVANLCIGAPHLCNRLIFVGGVDCRL